MEREDSVIGCRFSVGSWQLAVGSWQLAVGSWQLAKKDNEQITD
jgi:hypothetical protein